MSQFNGFNINPPNPAEVKQVETSYRLHDDDYLVRQKAHEFPLMIILALVYPCNFGCPNCPYSDGNSTLRKFYHDNKADLFPVELWNKLATEAGPHESFLRCTGGGEPMLHPKMTEMIEFAKDKGARVWLNTNGSRFGPDAKGRERLQRVIKAGIDIIEFSMDAGDYEAYAKLRPPIGGPPKDPEVWFNSHVGNIREALHLRKEYKSPTRIVVSMIRQEAIADKLDLYVKFYMEDVGVDEVITRKFLSWDDNTNINLEKSLDKHLYKDLPSEKKEPCVWPFERLNIDTMGRIALCGQDISFRTATLFPNAKEKSLKEIWQGEMFRWYREMHMNGRGNQCFPCRGCTAWFAGVRDWKHGWLKVLDQSGSRLKKMMREDLGAEVEIFEPNKAAEEKT
ncbi:MAG: radical SAM/SPASM domain-containing protein [Bdellovibrionales bacterium]